MDATSAVSCAALLGPPPQRATTVTDCTADSCSSKKLNAQRQDSGSLGTTTGTQARKKSRLDSSSKAGSQINPKPGSAHHVLRQAMDSVLQLSSAEFCKVSSDQPSVLALLDRQDRALVWARQRAWAVYQQQPQQRMQHTGSQAQLQNMDCVQGSQQPASSSGKQPSAAAVRGPPSSGGGAARCCPMDVRVQQNGSVVLVDPNHDKQAQQAEATAQQQQQGPGESLQVLPGSAAAAHTSSTQPSNSQGSSAGQDKQQLSLARGDPDRTHVAKRKASDTSYASGALPGLSTADQSMQLSGASPSQAPTFKRSSAAQRRREPGHAPAMSLLPCLCPGLLAPPQHNAKSRRKAQASLVDCNGNPLYKNVTWDTSRSKYRATIWYNRMRKHLGYFASCEAAARASDQAQLLLFSEHAELNFPAEDYTPGSESMAAIEKMITESLCARKPRVTAKAAGKQLPKIAKPRANNRQRKGAAVRPAQTQQEDQDAMRVLDAIDLSSEVPQLNNHWDTYLQQMLADESQRGVGSQGSGGSQLDANTIAAAAAAAAAVVAAAAAATNCGVPDVSGALPHMSSTWPALPSIHTGGKNSLHSAPHSGQMAGLPVLSVCTQPNVQAPHQQHLPALMPGLPSHPSIQQQQPQQQGVSDLDPASSLGLQDLPSAFQSPHMDLRRSTFSLGGLEDHLMDDGPAPAADMHTSCISLPSSQEHFSCKALSQDTMHQPAPPQHLDVGCTAQAGCSGTSQPAQHDQQQQGYAGSLQVAANTTSGNSGATCLHDPASLLDTTFLQEVAADSPGACALNSLDMEDQEADLTLDLFTPDDPHLLQPCSSAGSPQDPAPVAPTTSISCWSHGSRNLVGTEQPQAARSPMAAQQLQLVDNLALGQAGTGRLSDGGGSAQQCVDAYQVHQMFPSGPDPASGAGCRHDTATMPPSRSISPASNQVVFRLPAACQLQQQHSYSGASAALELSFTQPAAGLPPMPAPKQRAELVRVQGFTGVFWHTGRCAFRAYAPQHLPDGSKAKIKLGEFHTSDEAACAYDWFILTTQGPQGRTNYPASRYMTQQQPHQQYATGPCPAADLMARHPAAGMYSDYSHPTPSSSIDTQGMQVHHHRPGASSINQLQYSLGHAFDSCTSHKPSYCRQPPQQVQQHQQPLHMPEPGYQYGSHMQHSMPQHHMCRPLPSMYPAAPPGPTSRIPLLSAVQCRPCACG